MPYISNLHRQIHTEINDFIDNFLTEKVKESTKIGSSYERLWRTIHNVTLQGGKRIRPYLTTIGYKLNNNSSIEPLLPIAAAQELLHTSLLIHDDVIDKDTIRHGEKNINGHYIDLYSKSIDQETSTHFAHSASIIAGDLLISLSYQLINDSSWKPKQKQDVMTILSRSMYEVAAGQLMDIEAAFMNDSYDPTTIYRYKTSGYSFVSPLITGATLSDCSEETKQALENYGINLGIAYQLQDDILGVYGDEALTGKSNSCDIREAKRTFLVQSFLNTASTSDKELFNKTFGNINASSESIAELRKCIEDSGAKFETEKTIKDYSYKAKDAISNIPESDQKVELLNLVDFLAMRKK